MLTILLIFLANWLTGAQIRRFFGRTDTDLPANIFIETALGTAVNGWLALILAEIGQFKPLPLLIAWLLPILIARLKSAEKIPTQRPTPYALLALLWLPLASFLFFRPHQFIRGAADAGVYVNIANNLAKTGRLQIHDSSLATLDPQLYPALLRAAPDYEIEPYLYLPGFYIEQIGTGEITPQFYALHPVWQAIGNLVGGVEASLLLTGWWAMLGVLAVFMLARDLDRGFGRYLALAGLTLNAMQIWFARYPTTEPLAQFTLWTGIWAFSRTIDGRHEDKRLFATLAGLMFGSALLTRIDLFFLIPLPLLLAYLLRAESVNMKRANRRRSLLLAFTIPFGGLTVHTFAHAYFQSRPYFHGTFSSVFASISLTFLVAMLLLAGGLGGILWWLVQQQRVNWSRLWRGLRVVVVVLIIGLGIWGWWIRPNASLPIYTDWFSGQQRAGYDSQNLLRLGWYLGFSGVWLGIIGASWLLWRIKAQTMLLLGTGIFFTLLYVYHIRATFAQIYTMRRYVPVTLPFLILCAALLLGWLLTRKPLWQKGIGSLLTLIWLGSLLWLSRGFVTQVNEVGSIAQVAALADTLDPQAILIFNDSRPVGDADTLGTPLRFLHQRGVFGLRDLTNFDPSRFAMQLEEWQTQGYTIYWVETSAPDGYAWPLDPAQLGAAQPYRIELSALEETVEHKPVEIIPYIWEGAIYPVR